MTNLIVRCGKDNYGNRFLRLTDKEGLTASLDKKDFAITVAEGAFEAMLETLKTDHLHYVESIPLDCEKFTVRLFPFELCLDTDTNRLYCRSEAGDGYEVVGAIVRDDSVVWEKDVEGALCKELETA